MDADSLELVVEYFTSYKLTKNINIQHAVYCMSDVVQKMKHGLDCTLRRSLICFYCTATYVR